MADSIDGSEGFLSALVSARSGAGWEHTGESVEVFKCRGRADGGSTRTYADSFAYRNVRLRE